MTEKNIFVYKLFLWSNISYFSLFLSRNCNPFILEQSHLPLYKQPLLKIEILSSPNTARFGKFGRRLNPLSPAEGMGGGVGGAHYDHTYFLCLIVGRSETANFWEKTLKIIDNFSSGAFYSRPHTLWQLGIKE